MRQEPYRRQTNGLRSTRRMPDKAWSRRVRVAPPEWIGRITYRLCPGGMQRPRGDTIQCLFRPISRVRAARRTSTRPRPTHNQHARVGAMTIHHLDWMDRHSTGSRQDTHGTLGPYAGRPWVAHPRPQSTTPSATAQHGSGA